MNPLFPWFDLVDLVREMWSYPFMINAYRAGTAAALAAGLAGWFLVLRRQAFAGHTVSVIGFPGAAGAAVIGAPAWAGYLAFGALGALTLGRGTARRRLDGAVIATTQAVALAAGTAFVQLGGHGASAATASLFGSFLGVSPAQVQALVGVAVAVAVLLALIGRPLLFATVDPAVAAARGVPVAGLDLLFLLLVAGAVATAAQVAGALLVFVLLVLPAATVQRLTTRVGGGLVATVMLAEVTVWLALALAYRTDLPIGFCLAAVAVTGYLAAQAVPARALSLRRRPAREVTA